MVVEAWQPCECHVVVTLRFRDWRHWIYLFVHSPLDINFGDIILAKTDANGRCTEELFWLERGPTLKFGLQLDEIPDLLIEKLVSESPSRTIYGGDEDYSDYVGGY